MAERSGGGVLYDRPGTDLLVADGEVLQAKGLRMSHFCPLRAPLGVRVSVGEFDEIQRMAAMRPKFLRFPGGCLVHDGALDPDARNSQYRWKNFSHLPVSGRRFA